MEEALRIIIAKSPNAASFALQCMQAIRTHSPTMQARYNQTVSIAFNDPQASFTAEERAIIAESVGSGESDSRDYTLRIRLTKKERVALARMAEDANLSMSEYARRVLFA